MLFPKLYPKSPNNVIEAYQALFKSTGGPADPNDIDDASSVSSATTATSHSHSTTSGEFHPQLGEFYKQKGLTWHTAKPSKGLLGILNSCNVDGFLTNLAIQFNRKKYDFKGLLRHTMGPGQHVEDLIRTITSIHKKKDGGQEVVSRQIKQKWIDLTHIGTLQNAGKVINIAGDEDLHIFDHLDDVTRFEVLMRCKCSGPVQPEERHDINVCTNTEIDKALKGRIRNPEGDQYPKCETCHTKPTTVSYLIPPTTWILHFVIDNGAGKKLDHSRFPATIKPDGNEWFKSYASYWTQAGRGLQGLGHTVSLHFIKKKAYFYDDLKDNGSLYYFGEGPIQKDAYLQHVVYLRTPKLLP